MSKHSKQLNFERSNFFSYYTKKKKTGSQVPNWFFYPIFWYLFPVLVIDSLICLVMQ